MLLRTYLDHCLVSCWLGDPRFPGHFERTSCAVVFRKSRTARHCNASVLDGRSFSDACLDVSWSCLWSRPGYPCCKCSGEAPHTACGMPATGSALQRSCACSCDWMAMVPNLYFTLHTFTYMMLLRFTFTRQCVSPEYDYMLCPCVSGVHEGIAMQVPVLLCPLLPFCIESPSHLKHLQPGPLVWICS